MGAMVQYCGHDGCFVADIYRVGNINVVVATGPVTPGNLKRPAEKYKPTHHLEDFPEAGYWAPQKGIFVVLEDQVTELGQKDPPEVVPPPPAIVRHMIMKMPRSVGKSTAPFAGIKSLTMTKGELTAKHPFSPKKKK